MNRWENRVAVVTGASSGIGAACSVDLIALGMIVVGLARREDGLTKFKDSLTKEQAERFIPRPCDVSEEQQVIDTFAWIDETLGGADVLVNNAAISMNLSVIDHGNSDEIRHIFNTNVLGATWCTREAFFSMQRRQINDGHVVFINSIFGHTVPFLKGFKNSMYAPSKFAITALTEVLRKEFLNKGTMIKVTSISPGIVNTKTQNVNFTDMATLRPEDVSDAVKYCIQTPPNVQIHELTIKPLGEMV